MYSANFPNSSENSNKLSSYLISLLNLSIKSSITKRSETYNYLILASKSSIQKKNEINSQVTTSNELKVNLTFRFTTLSLIVRIFQRIASRIPRKYFRSYCREIEAMTHVPKGWSEWRRFIARKRGSRVFRRFHQRRRPQRRRGWVSWKTIGGYPGYRRACRRANALWKLGEPLMEADTCRHRSIGRPATRSRTVGPSIWDREKNDSIWITTQPRTTGRSALVRRNHFAGLRETQSRWV